MDQHQFRYFSPFRNQRLSYSVSWGRRGNNPAGLLSSPGHSSIWTP